jgi:hypothetical protein
MGIGIDTNFRKDALWIFAVNSFLATHSKGALSGF